MYDCLICGKNIPENTKQLVYCLNCQTYFHFECIRKKLYQDKICPSCEKRLTLLGLGHGKPRESRIHEVREPRVVRIKEDKRSERERLYQELLARRGEGEVELKEGEKKVKAEKKKAEKLTTTYVEKVLPPKYLKPKREWILPLIVIFILVVVVLGYFLYKGGF
ncbi:MAG: hypothetical protein ACE5K0_02975 [Candidatus Methanofastidiosia archaeon]